MVCFISHTHTHTYGHATFKNARANCFSKSGRVGNSFGRDSKFSCLLWELLGGAGSLALTPIHLPMKILREGLVSTHDECVNIILDIISR